VFWVYWHESPLLSLSPPLPPPAPLLQAQDHNKSGDYESARSSGRFALIFNIVAFISGPIIYGIIILSLIIYYATASAAVARSSPYNN